MQIVATSGDDKWAIEAILVFKNNQYCKRNHLKDIYLKQEPEYHSTSFKI